MPSHRTPSLKTLRTLPGVDSGKAVALKRLLTAHTPGPWYADKLQDRTAFNIFMPGYDSAGAQVFHCSNATACMGPQVEANARLIAAAPDLLAALRTLVDYFGPHPDVDNGLDEALTAARAALSAATGEA